MLYLIMRVSINIWYSASDTVDYVGILEGDSVIKEVYKPIFELMHKALNKQKEISAGLLRIKNMKSSY